MIVNIIVGLWHLLSIVVEPLAIILFFAGLAVWLFCYMIPPNTLGIPVFLGGRRMNHVMEEGLNFYLPFCRIITHLLSPRERTDIDFTVNVLDDEIQCSGKIGFQLLRPAEMERKMRELGIKEVAQESNYLILYNRKQDKIETDALARIKEMLDEMLTKIPAECALTKELNDAVQLCIVKGIEHREEENGDTAQQKVIKLVTGFKESYIKKLVARGIAPNEIPEIKIPEELKLPDNDDNIRGIERIFLEDYGALLTIHTLTLEPSEKTMGVRTQQRTREIEREIERMDTELVMSMIAKVKKEAPGLTDKEVRDLVMVVQEYNAKPTIEDINVNIKGLENVPAETLLALGTVLKKTGKPPGKKNRKGGKQ